MSAERGWIGDPQPPKEWHDSRYSRQADRLRRIAERNWRRIEESIRRDEQELAEGDGAVDNGAMTDRNFVRKWAHLGLLDEVACAGDGGVVLS